MGNKFLFIGDVHATPEELGDCEALIGLVEETTKAHNATPVFLGDQYNTHNIVRVEVMWFWRNAFARLQPYDPIAMVGNHDFAGEGLPMHAMVAHEESVMVIDAPITVDGILFMPYFSDRAAFVRECVDWKNFRTVVCHQTFDGAKYENGFYTQDGVDPDLIPQQTIISGHIHTPQSFGKVTYLGAPRWRTLSDADVERAIWLYEFDDSDTLVAKTSFSTGDTCRQIKYRLHTPESPALELDSRHDWRIDIKGPADWVEKSKTELAVPGVRIRTFKTDKAVSKIRESQGIDVAFHAYLEQYVPKYGTERKQLHGMAKDRLHV